MNYRVYETMPGSIADRVINLLRSHNTGLPSRVIADELQIDPDISAYLEPACRAGLLRKEKTKGLVYWNLGNGLPIYEEEDDVLDERQRYLAIKQDRASDKRLDEILADVRKAKFDGVDIDAVHRNPALIAQPAVPEHADIVTAEPPAEPDPNPFKVGLWGDGALQIRQPDGAEFTLSPENTRLLAGYLGRHLVEPQV